jgi:hypothetical protein
MIPQVLVQEVDTVECRACRGEGYFYEPVEGRFAATPIAEMRCEVCKGLGYRVLDANQLELW